MAQSRWAAWLAAAKRADQGGIVWPDAIVRGSPFSLSLPIPGDLTGETFSAELRADPDAGGSPLATFTVVVDPFDPVLGVTVVNFNLSASQTAIGALPGDANGDGIEELPMDIVQTTGSTRQPVAAFVIIIRGRITA